MATLLAQTATTGEWYDGWQILAIVVGAALIVLIIFISLLYKYQKADRSKMKADIEEDIAEVKNHLGKLDDRFWHHLLQSPRQQPQYDATARPAKPQPSPPKEVNPPAAPQPEPPTFIKG